MRRHRNIEIHIVVLHPLPLHPLHRLAEHIVHPDLDTRAAVVVRIDRILERLCHIAVAIVRPPQGGNVGLQERADTLRAQVRQLAIVRDARRPVHRNAQPLPVEHHRAIAEVAVAAVILNPVRELRPVRRRRNRNLHLFARLHHIRQRMLQERLRQAADRAARVRRVHVVRPQRIVVRVALDMLAIVAQPVHQVQPHPAVLIERVDQVRNNRDETLVVQLLLVRQPRQRLLRETLHIALPLHHHLRQRIPDLVLVSAVQQPLARLTQHRHRQQRHQRQEYYLFHSVSVYIFYCRFNTL